MNEFGTPSTEQLTKINKLAKRSLSADEVFMFSGKSAGDMMIPGRYMRLSPQLLKVMVDDAQKGVSFMLNHNWSKFGGIQAVPYGKVFDGKLTRSNAEGETMALFLDKYIVRDEEATDGISANALIKKIETGVLSDTSIGWTTDVMTCSICAKNYYGGECHHIRGIKYDMGDGSKKICTVTAMPPSIIIPYNNNALMEESIVWDGAYPGAMVTQAKGGDIVELPTGKYSVVGDKEELPEGTPFYGKYHNGDIIAMVKKSEPNKIFGSNSLNISGDEIDLAKTHDMYHEMYNKRELPANWTMRDLVQKHTETVEALITQQGHYMNDALDGNLPGHLKTKSLRKEQTTMELDKVGACITQEQIKEKLGKEFSADEVLSLAKDGQAFRKEVTEDAIRWGVRAQGNDFPAETWKNTFEGMSIQAIRDIMKTFESQAKAAIPAGRKTNPTAGTNMNNLDVTVPNDFYRTNIGHEGR